MRPESKLACRTEAVVTEDVPTATDSAQCSIILLGRAR